MSSIIPQKNDNAEIIISPVARTADEVNVALPDAANSFNTGSPKHGATSKAEAADGSVIIRFILGEASDKSVKVTLTKDGTSETKDIEITFSGEKSGILGGCNTGAVILVLLALCPFIIRRRS